MTECLFAKSSTYLNMVTTDGEDPHLNVQVQMVNTSECFIVVVVGSLCLCKNRSPHMNIG